MADGRTRLEHHLDRMRGIGERMVKVAAARTSRQVERHPDAIQQIRAYLETGYLDGGSTDEVSRLPEVVGPFVVKITVLNHEEYVAIDTFEVCGPFAPVLPFIQEANIRGRVSDHPLSSLLTGADISAEPPQKGIAYFTFTNTRSAGENLEDFVHFVRSQEESAELTERVFAERYPQDRGEDLVPYEDPDSREDRADASEAARILSNSAMPLFTLDEARRELNVA